MLLGENLGRNGAVCRRIRRRCCCHTVSSQLYCALLGHGVRPLGAVVEARHMTGLVGCAGRSYNEAGAFQSTFNFSSAGGLLMSAGR